MSDKPEIIIDEALLDRALQQVRLNEQAGSRYVSVEGTLLAALVEELRVREKALRNVVAREQHNLYYEGMGSAAPIDRIDTEVAHELDLVREYDWGNDRAALGLEELDHG